MTDIVLKPFNATSRRFAAAMPIGPSDDVAPHNYQDLRDRGFIGDPPVAEAREARIPLKAAAKVETATSE